MNNLKNTDTKPMGRLDPSDWEAFQTALNTIVTAALEKFRSTAGDRVWTPPPDSLKKTLEEALPQKGTDLSELTERLIGLLPYGVGNTHPRFFGWVHGSGTPGNLLAEIIAAAMNPNCGGRDHIAIYIERQLIGWCKTLMGFPETASGLIVTGTSMATLIAAKTARDAALSFSNRALGLNGARLTAYTSEQAHSCIARAFDLLGLGSDALRKVRVTPEFKIDVEDLTRQIERDRALGFQPFFLAGTAGTVNTAAIDDLVQLAEISRRENLWFHIDGAFAACAMTSPEIRPKLKGIEQADSIAFDFHKWMHVNYDAGCVLIRHADLHHQAFTSRPDYLAAGGKAVAAGDPWPVDFGPELSRGFRALKVWAHWLEHGSEKIGQAITMNCQQAAYLARRIDADKRFERAAPVSLHICCLRYNAPGLSPDAGDTLNARIVEQIQWQGLAVPSTTRLNGRLVIRVNITNHRTRQEDMDILFEALEHWGHKLSAQP